MYAKRVELPGKEGNGRKAGFLFPRCNQEKPRNNPDRNPLSDNGTGNGHRRSVSGLLPRRLPPHTPCPAPPTAQYKRPHSHGSFLREPRPTPPSAPRAH